jgi:PHD/YefM family antitoxin component YafN of YafNO toxin-antitoxin module
MTTLSASEARKKLEETLYLTSIPGMRESIKRGLKTSVERCAEEPGW